MRVSISRTLSKMAHSIASGAKPCKVGDKIQDIYTPALVVDLDGLYKNLELMKTSMQKFGRVNLRPHGKAHKCPEIAKLQVAHGAVGICCQTLTEAESMVAGGIKNILVSNQVIGLPKLLRLAALARDADISVCVDDEDNLRTVSQAAENCDVKLGVVVEVNVGQDRCGVEPGKAAVSLAQVAQKLSGVEFRGIQCYNGLNQHIREAGDRKNAVALVVTKTEDTLKGSYVFMDADYGRDHGSPVHDYLHTLFVLSTVQSVTSGKRVVVDAGMKAVSLDSGEPLVKSCPDVTYTCGGDEHGILHPPGNWKIEKEVDTVWPLGDRRGVAGGRLGVARAGTLRPHRQPLRLAGRCPWRQRRSRVANHGTRTWHLKFSESASDRSVKYDK
ncbi:PREDICTED: D-threonine aldolase-like isoform X3 [Priapulus caudatus]|uniref:D-threonine aldolase-like isoform X3 n=1 Tax=Priapulus caudatus TaxID=37621 RepID=A0ABM1EYR5_PRICU|nr:PREDICTED: D-threonine aldolase-like isoform X3 [Priapulus caudatus]